MFKYFIVIAGLLGIMAGCDSTGDNYEVAESGLNYRFSRQGDGPKPVDGNILLMNVSYLSSDGQLLFSTAQAGGPMAINYDNSSLDRIGGLEEGLKMIKQGDSLLLQYPIENLFEITFGIDFPDSLERGSNVTVCIGLEKVFTADEYNSYIGEKTAERKQKALESNRAMIDSDGKIIDDYLAEKGINAQIHESGIRYNIISEGSGELAKNGQFVRVNYTGRVLDGRLFDSSVEETVKKEGQYNPGRTYEPYRFQLGTGSVIEGWDIGIALLNPGAKAFLYIPSSLAYGSQNRSAVIGPDEILIFEVELVEVTD